MSHQLLSLSLSLFESSIHSSSFLQRRKKKIKTLFLGRNRFFLKKNPHKQSMGKRRFF
jgi:hypothetical protein